MDSPTPRPRLIFVSVLHRKCFREEGRRVQRNSITNWCHKKTARMVYKARPL